MRRSPVSRRRFLTGAAVSGASLALAAEGTWYGSAQQGSEAVSPQLLGQLATYGDFPLPPDRAAELTPLLAGPLAVLRGLRPPNYDTLPPAAVFRVPAEG